MDITQFNLDDNNEFRTMLVTCGSQALVRIFGDYYSRRKVAACQHTNTLHINNHGLLSFDVSDELLFFIAVRSGGLLGSTPSDRLVADESRSLNTDFLISAKKQNA